MKKLQSIIFLSLLVSCTLNENKIEDAVYFTYNDFGNPIELKGEILPTEKLWKPTRIYFTDSVFVLVDNHYGDFFVQVRNKNNLDLISENIPKGIGPDERLSCWTLQINSDYIWALDMQAQKMTAYSKDDFLSYSNVKPYKTVTFNDWPVGTISLLNKTFIGSCLTDTINLLSLYDYNGIRDNTQKNKHPLLNIETENIISKKRLFEHRIQYSEENNKVVVFYVYTDLIEIYDENLNLLSRIQGPDFFLPKLDMRDNFIHTIKEKTKFAYTIGCLTSAEIWALYYGTSPDDKGIKLPNRIFVFDYNGKPLRSYNLEYPIYMFSIDEKNSILYGLSEYPEPCIIKFNL